MYRLILALLIFSSSLIASAASYTPNTTLAAETGNNTSAAASFAAQSNGNIAGSNISKVPMRSLLYSGSSAKIYAHFVPWFGFGDHMNVGYTSNDPAQVQKQVVDMVSRGFDGAIIDWYGRGESNTNFVYYDQATQDLMHEAEQHPGFNFAVMEDVGALKTCALTAGCNITQTMIDDLNYANTTYWNSPAYLKFNGRPVVYFFGEEAYTNIDWNAARSAVAGNPIFVFRNSVGFTSTQTNGGYAWVEPTQPSLTYLDGFYTAALQFPGDYVTGSGYKGFNDSLAAWTQNRSMPQNCGQTWLASVAEAGKYYSAGNQMFGIQLVTWNDYEEGTEIETGIDNCVSVSASVSGTVLNWSISGQMSTVDHFSVYISQDGQNLMWLSDVPTTSSSVDLASFGLPAGNYTAFVKAVGKPSLTNKMSAGAQVTLAGNPPPAAGISLTTPNGTTATVSAGQTASWGLQVSATGANANVSVACTTTTPGGACSGPAGSITVVPGTPDSLTITVSTAAHGSAAPAPSSRTIPPAPWLFPVAAMLSMGSALAWFSRKAAWFFSVKRVVAFLSPASVFSSLALIFAGTRKHLLAPAGLLLGLALVAGCGGGGSLSTKGSNAPNPTPSPTPSGGTPSGSYTVVVTATSGSLTQTQTLTLNVK